MARILSVGLLAVFLIIFQCGINNVNGKHIESYNKYSNDIVPEEIQAEYDPTVMGYVLMPYSIAKAKGLNDFRPIKEIKKIDVSKTKEVVDNDEQDYIIEEVNDQTEVLEKVNGILDVIVESNLFDDEFLSKILTYLKDKYIADDNKEESSSTNNDVAVEKSTVEIEDFKSESNADVAHVKEAVKVSNNSPAMDVEIIISTNEHSHGVRPKSLFDKYRQIIDLIVNYMDKMDSPVPVQSAEPEKIPIVSYIS